MLVRPPTAADPLYHLTGSERQKRLLDALGNPAAPAPTPANANANGDVTEGDATAAAAPMATERSSDPTPSSSSAATTSQKKPAQKKQDPNALPKEVATTLPEADAYLSLLVLLTLLDKSPTADVYPAAQQYAAQEIEHFAQMNRRTMDQLASKFYFYWVRAHELNGDDSTVLRP